MTQREKLARAKMSLIELAEYLKNVSEACRVMGVSRQHFYDIKGAYADGGMPALQEKSQRKPNFKNRVAPEIEAASQGSYHKTGLGNHCRQDDGLYVSIFSRYIK